MMCKERRGYTRKEQLAQSNCSPKKVKKEVQKLSVVIVWTIFRGLFRGMDL